MAREVDRDLLTGRDRAQFGPGLGDDRPHVLLGGPYRLGVGHRHVGSDLAEDLVYLVTQHVRLHDVREAHAVIGDDEVVGPLLHQRLHGQSHVLTLAVDAGIDAVADADRQVLAVSRAQPLDYLQLLGELLVVVGRASAHHLPLVPCRQSDVLEHVGLAEPRAARQDVMSRRAVGLRDVETGRSLRRQPRVHQLRSCRRRIAVEAARVLRHRARVDHRDPRRDQAHLDQVAEELPEALVGELVVFGRLAVVDQQHSEPGIVRTPSGPGGWDDREKGDTDEQRAQNPSMHREGPLFAVVWRC